jgi:hypothetical protein
MWKNVQLEHLQGHIGASVGFIGKPNSPSQTLDSLSVSLVSISDPVESLLLMSVFSSIVLACSPPSHSYLETAVVSSLSANSI